MFIGYSSQQLFQQYKNLIIIDQIQKISCCLLAQIIRYRNLLIWFWTHVNILSYIHGCIEVSFDVENCLLRILGYFMTSFILTSSQQMIYQRMSMCPFIKEIPNTLTIVFYAKKNKRTNWVMHSWTFPFVGRHTNSKKTKNSFVSIFLYGFERRQ